MRTPEELGAIFPAASEDLIRPRFLALSIVYQQTVQSLGSTKRLDRCFLGAENASDTIVDPHRLPFVVRGMGASPRLLSERHSSP